MNDFMPKKTRLTIREVLKGYDAVCSLYLNLPSINHWRSWEYAAYRHFRVGGKLLDIGCGDGRYFKLIWPRADNVVGVDLNPAVAELARLSNVYRKIHVTPAHRIPEDSKSFDHVFANCSLEHMDHLDGVLSEIERCLKPGGSLLCSVVTNRFVEWSLLPILVAAAGYDEAAMTLQKDFHDYHHLSNPLPENKWIHRFENAGLIVEEHIPILPKYNTGIFLAMDAIWHTKNKNGGEMGDTLTHFFSRNDNFRLGLRTIYRGLMEMEIDWDDCSGAVFFVRKPR